MLQPSKILLWFTALIIACLPPFLLINNWWMHRRIDPWVPWSCIGIGIATIIIYTGLVYLQSRKDPLFQELKFEFQFAKSHAPSAIIIGGSLATLFTGIHFLYDVTPSHPIQERYEAVLPLYITLIAAAFGVKLLYRRVAPITDPNFLLEVLIEDLKKCREGSELWAVFPALNIAFHRNRWNLGSDLPPEHITQQFKNELEACATRLRDNSHAITYPAKLYNPLYQRYHAMLANKEPADFDESDREVVEACELDAKECIEKVIGGVRPRGRHHELLPNEFPAHVMIIGRVTYMLMSYGIPIYEPDPQRPDKPDQNEYYGSFVSVDKEPVMVLAYRREDPAVSRAISKHLLRLIQTIENRRPPESRPSLNSKAPLPQRPAKSTVEVS